MVARVRTVAFHGVEVLEVETQVTIASGLPTFTVVGLPDKAVAESRERVRSALDCAGPRAAAEADHRQPRAGRRAEGRQPFRPADRAGPVGRDGGAAGRRARRLCGARRIVARRVGDERRGGAARGPRRRRAAERHHLPRGLRRRGGLGRSRDHRGTEPLSDRQPFQGDAAVAAARAARRAVAIGGARPQGCEGPGERQARPRDRRRRRPQPVDGRPAGCGQVDAGGTPARDPAVARTGRGA